MRRPGWRGALVFLALTIITVANFTLRDDGKSAPTLASTFTVGDPMPPLKIRPLTSGGASAAALAPAGCHVVVVFASSCKHCHIAAARAKLRQSDRNLPTIWVSHTDDEAALAFERDLGDAGVVAYGGPEVFRKLKVNAVPTAFLVTPARRVARVWVYTGEEDPAELEAACVP